MAIVPYLAMTAAELAEKGPLAFPAAWMACHFSSYGTGLSNLPQTLPEGSLLILNDRTPVFGHDPDRIAGQLEEAAAQLGCSGILLDFQRPGEPQTQAIAAAAAALPCPVAVTPAYAEGLDCAVFLPPPPLTAPLQAHLGPWQGRSVWLELAIDRAMYRVDPNGCRQIADHAPIPCPHTDECLHCRYGTDVQPQHIDFYLMRDRALLQALMEEAAALGVQRFIGLYQQLGNWE